MQKSVAPYTPLLALMLIGLAALVADAPAQIKQGDLVLGSISSTPGKGGVFYVDWNTGALGTLQSGIRANSVRTGWGNGHVWFTDFAVTPTHLFSITPNGLLRTAHTSTAGRDPQNFAIDQIGEYVGASSDSRVYKYYLGGGLKSTLAAIPGGGWLSGITRDERSGDYYVTRTNDSRIFRVDRDTGAVNTFTQIPGSGTIFDIASVPSTGEFVVARFNLTAGILFVNRAGGVRKTIGISHNVASVTVDPVRDRIFVGTTSGVIAEFTSAGDFVWSRNFPGYNWQGIDVYDDQAVSVLATGQQASRAVAQLRFNRSPNRSYCVALSLGIAPAVHFGPTQHLNLQVDLMFLLTACGGLPYWTTGFAGLTSASGAAGAIFIVPLLTPGTRLFVSAVAFNPSFPNGLDVANTEVIEITP